VLCVDKSDSELEDESVVSDARNNDARDTSRLTQFQQIQKLSHPKAVLKAT
jgi:flavoprotein